MSGMTEMFEGDPMAGAFGLLGLLCQLTWPLFRSRQAILRVQFGIGAGYCAQYALLGAWSGVGVTGLGATQTLIACLAGDRPWLRQSGLVFLPVLGLICAATWTGIETLFAVTACALTMLGRLQRDTLTMRVLLFAAAPFGIGYDLMAGALPALTGALISLCIAGTMLVKELKSRGYRLPRFHHLHWPLHETVRMRALPH